MDHRRVVPSLSLLAVGCSGGFDSKLETEHFVYRHDQEDSDVCEGLGDELELHRSVMADYLGVIPPSPIVYKKFVDEVDRGPCANENRACARNHKVFSNRVVDRHELVHVYVNEEGDSDFLVSEAIAEALECDARQLLPTDPPTIGWRDVTSDGSEDYLAAKFLGVHLLRKFGPETLLDWYRTTGDPADNERLARAFEETFSSNLDEEYEQAVRGPSCLHEFECRTSTELPLGGETFRASQSCTGRTETFSLQVDEPSLLEFETASQGDFSSGLVLLGCATDGPGTYAPTPVQVSSSSINRLGRYFLQPGAYALAPSAQVDMKAWLTPMTDELTSCESAPVFDLSPGATESFKEFHFFVPGDQGRQHLRFEHPTDVEPSFVTYELHEYGNVRFCSDCTQQECKTLSREDLGDFRAQMPRGTQWVIIVDDLSPSRGLSFTVSAD